MKNKLNLIPDPSNTLDSRDVAKMVGKAHFHLLRDINEYIAGMGKITQSKNGLSNPELKIEVNDFFISSTYIDSTGRTLPNYLITKKGCEFVANKLTGEKGTKFTAAYVTRFNEMEHQQKAIKSKAPKTDQELSAADKRATAMMLNAKTRIATQLQKLYDRANVKPEYQALALSDFYSTDGVNLPRIALRETKVTYDKGIIAKRLGVYSISSGGNIPHAQAIGAIISDLNIADNEREAVPYCHNGHHGTDYQYTESVIDKVRDWLEQNQYCAPIVVGGKKYRVTYRQAQN